MGMSKKTEQTFHSFAALGETKTNHKEARRNKQAAANAVSGQSAPQAHSKTSENVQASQASQASLGSKGAPVRTIPGNKGTGSKGTGSGKNAAPAADIDPADTSLFLAAMAAVSPTGHKGTKQARERHPKNNLTAQAGGSLPTGAPLTDEDMALFAATTRFGQPLGPLAAEQPASALAPAPGTKRDREFPFVPKRVVRKLGGRCEAPTQRVLVQLRSGLRTLACGLRHGSSKLARLACVACMACASQSMSSSPSSR